MGSKKEIVKDNAVVFYFPNVETEVNHQLFSSPFKRDYEYTGFNTVLDGTSLGAVDVVTLTPGEHTVEVYFGEIIGEQEMFINWISDGVVFDLDFSRMDFSKAVFLDQFMCGCPFLRNLNLSYLEIHGVIYLFQVGMGVDPTTSTWTIENTSIINTDELSGGFLSNTPPNNNIILKNVYINSSYDRTSNHIPTIGFGSTSTSLVSLDLSSVNIEGTAILNSSFWGLYKEIYLNMDPSKIISEYPAASDGLEIQYNEGILPTLYYNQNYPSDVWAILFPNWNLVPIAMTDYSVYLSKIEIEVQPYLYCSQTTVPYKIIRHYKSSNNSYSTEETRTHTVHPMSTTGNTVKTIVFTEDGIIGSASFTHLSLKPFDWAVHQNEVEAGDVLVSNGEGGFAYIRLSNGIPSGWTPIGVCVVPPAHGRFLYGAGSCIGLKVIDRFYYTYEMYQNGSISEYQLYNGSRLQDSNRTLYYNGTLENHTCNHTASYVGSSNSDPILDTGVYCPSDNFNGVVNNCDSEAFYSSEVPSGSYVCASPYWDGWANITYGDTDDIFSFDGKEVTKHKISQTSLPQYRDDYSEQHAAWGCYLYNVEPYLKNEWYVPSLGEIGYFIARFKKIKNTFDQLRSLGYEVKSLNNNVNNISSNDTELEDVGMMSCTYTDWNSNYHFRTIDWRDGRLKHWKYNSYKAPVYPFVQL